MNAPSSSRIGRLVLTVSLVVVGVLSLERLLRHDPVPWVLVVGFAVLTALLAGPVAWVARDRLSDARRELLTLVAFVAALLSMPSLIAVGLLTGSLAVFVDAGTFGGLVGFAVAVLADGTPVSDRFRRTAT